MKQYSNNIPKKRITRLIYGMQETILNYGCHETSEEDLLQIAKNRGEEEIVPRIREDFKYTYYTTVLPLGEDGYALEVSTIINDQYPADKMQAIQNNYFADPTDEEAIAEMQEMQKWRKIAKEFASDIKGVD